MTFSQDSKLNVALRVVRGIALIWALTTPIAGTSALTTPQRPAASAPTKSAAENYPGPGRYRGPHTYLAMVGPAALRFADVLPPLPPEPVPPALPIPKTPPPETLAAVVPATTITPQPDKPGSPTPTPTPTETELPAPGSPKPISILPDDTKNEIRAEDVLPFFQFPSASDGSSLSVPSTSSQSRAPSAPPSSATYRLQ